MSVSTKNLARWYRELSQHLKAGSPLPRALESAGGVPARDRRRFAEQLRAGDTIESVLTRAPRWLPEVDRQVLSAAAQSGQLVETLQVLAVQRGFAAKQTGKAVGAVIYPLFVIHVAILVVPLLIIGIGDLEAYGRLVLLSLLTLWAIIALLFWSVRQRHRWVSWAMGILPLLRGYGKTRSVADICFTLRAYLAAGETVDVAWFGAARACADRRMKRLGEAVSEKARHGTPPGQELGKGMIFPEDFVSLYQAGELTGQLDDNLYHLWTLYDERAADKLRAASFWYPMLLVLGVMVGVAYFVITAYTAYLNTIMDML